VELDHAVGLSTSDGAAPGAFEVSTDKRSWQTAEATIAGNQITVAGNGIAAVRYAWSDVPADANVVNTDGLPMAPFRWTKFDW
jgi:sialate O-acetylesterase